jgi:hypothetical protein
MEPKEGEGKLGKLFLLFSAFHSARMSQKCIFSKKTIDMRGPFLHNDLIAAPEVIGIRIGYLASK